MKQVIFDTDRLDIVVAENCPEHIELFFRLWNNPEVMKNVGFPEGLGVTREDISRLIQKKNGSVPDALLVVIRKLDGVAIGECKLGSLDEYGISNTDVKLLPEFWGRGYGTEIKRGLVTYLFEKTSCKAVRATPNIENRASQKMQERVGARLVGSGVYKFPSNMRQKTRDVQYLEYLLTREDWLESNAE